MMHEARDPAPHHPSTHQPYVYSARPPLSTRAALETKPLVYPTGTYEHFAAVIGFLREQ